MGNSEENKSEEKKSYFIHWLLGGAVGVFISVTLLFFYINKWTLPTVNDENNTLSNLGTIGDYFGGLINPLLGFVSFCALLYTIRIQMKSLAKQSEELELTREELRATKEELARSALAQEQSSVIFKQQQFESTFFSLLNQIIMGIDSFHKANIKTDKHNITEHKVMVNILKGDFWYSALEKINKCDASLPKIFILIYQLLKLISKYESELSIDVGEEDAFKIAKIYSNILRACLDRDFLHLFAINGCNKKIHNMTLYREYIEKYSLLEHIIFNTPHAEKTEDIFKNIMNNYSEIAFGNNDTYKKYIEEKNQQNQT